MCHITVETEQAYEMVRRLAQVEGMLAGIWPSAATVAALEVAAGFKSGVLVIIFPDSGDKYLSSRFWSES